MSEADMIQHAEAIRERLAMLDKSLARLEDTITQILKEGPWKTYSA